MTRYEARSFYGPFKEAFARVYPMVGVPKLGYPHVLANLFNVDQWLYAPIVKAGARMSVRLSRTHVGVPQMYLVWQVAGMAIVVSALFWLLR